MIDPEWREKGILRPGLSAVVDVDTRKIEPAAKVAQK
jgi:hypothetical protein